MAVIDNLESYWSMEDGAGNNATDSHGSNTLTQANSPGSAAGKVSNCRDLENASQHYFEILDNASISTGDISFSWQAWINLESKPGAGTFDYVVQKANEYLLFYDGDTDRIKFSVFNGVSYATATWGSALSLATWYHVIGTYDATADEVTIIVDNGTPVVTTGATSGNDAATVCRFGDQSDGMDGLLDEVGFWKKELSAAEVTWLYNSGNGRSYADIQAEAGAASAARMRRSRMFMGVGR